MLIQQHNSNTIITQEVLSISALISKIQESYSKFKNDNLIVILNALSSISKQNLLEFDTLSKAHRKQNHSFIIVTSAVAIDSIPETIIVVPTLQEAYDIIEMEEMERDLGL